MPPLTLHLVILGCKAQLPEIEAEMKCELKDVCWLPDFYYLPPDVRIASTMAYQEAKMQLQELAVSALDISPGDHVLDLCAAPGVDVARHRLAASRTMVQKYALGDRCRLFVADGTTFSLIPSRVQSNSISYNAEVDKNCEIYSQWTSRRSWKELGFGKHDVFQNFSDVEISQLGYDKVLVDAECTHDGSIKHIQKFQQWGWTTLSRRVLDADRTDDVTVLQLKLLTNGFRLLKVGGCLVYSTCSLTVAQNEDVVEQFLSKHVSAGRKVKK
ncbi:multisite-specific tRNA:(cytosine-c(5))-methyltransferase trm4b [Phtheirospermum japonicum]|uniref:Multisite-specific tRNA:(Cytosine-c(5))-methyltransferase trm4b n=1 Tax=Phtheirospermum japonicum TaxID=374723 RepID=A0A830DKX0_9LAMI|nr:multisite-specific tRNA:(cytosine-c(5))-methyltransferase trm4b [Phtheirospermum japonicum]